MVFTLRPSTSQSASLFGALIIPFWLLLSSTACTQPPLEDGGFYSVSVAPLEAAKTLVNMPEDPNQSSLKDEFNDLFDDEDDEPATPEQIKAAEAEQAATLKTLAQQHPYGVVKVLKHDGNTVYFKLFSNRYTAPIKQLKPDSLTLLDPEIGYGVTLDANKKPKDVSLQGGYGKASLQSFNKALTQAQPLSKEPLSPEDQQDLTVLSQQASSAQSNPSTSNPAPVEHIHKQSPWKATSSSPAQAPESNNP